MPALRPIAVRTPRRLAGARGALAALLLFVSCRASLPPASSRSASDSAATAASPAVAESAAGSTSPAAPSAAPASPKPRRVLLLSLDGAAVDTLMALDRDGALGAGGFSRFLGAGEVARLVPVNPTLTAPNHVSLATGRVAGDTGIVANSFHPAGAPWPRAVSGFDAPIAAETLWEAARRQGRRVGIVTWPGADGTEERRRGDWGLVYVTRPSRAAELVTLTRVDFHPVAGGRERGEEPSLVARAGGYELVVRAARGSNAEEYGRLSVRQSGGERALRPGEWTQLDENPRRPPAAGSPGRWAKLLELDPRLAAVRLYLGGVYPLRAYPRSYADALAARDLAWPGPPDDRRLGDRWRGRPGIDLDTWAEQAGRFAAFFGGALRVAAARPDWDLLMGYLPSIDEAGHQLLLTDPRQPGYSAERVAACELGRRRVWQAVDRELAQLLAAVDLSSTVVAVVSDHGMAPIHAGIDPNALLAERGLLVFTAGGEPDPARSAAFAVSDGGVSHVYLAPGGSGSVERPREALTAELRDLFAGWKVGAEPAIERVVDRADAAEVGLASADAGDLILFAAEGYCFRDLGTKRSGGHPATSGMPPTYGMHGYLNSHPDMHGIYLAVGAGIEKRRLDPLSSTDIAGRVAAWMGIEKPLPAPLPVPAQAPAAAPAGR